MQLVSTTAYLSTYADNLLSADMPWAAEAIGHCVRSNKHLHQSSIRTVKTSQEVRPR